jgi:PHD-finger
MVAHSSFRPGFGSTEIEEKKKKADNENDNASMSSDEASLDIGACSLCHCAIDWSDRAAFFRADREVDYNASDDPAEYYFRPTDPYLPPDLHDPNNALVYCDTCDRMYHQRCHFVPLLVVPRGEWSCLVCQSRRSFPASKTAKKATKGGGGASNKRGGDGCDSNDDLLFASPPQPAARQDELRWEAKKARAKAAATQQQIQKVVQYCRTQLGNYRLATTAVDTFTSTQKNMHHFILRRGAGSASSSATSSNNRSGSSQELAQTVLKLAASKYKLRGAVLSVDAWRRGTDAVRAHERLCGLVRADGADNGSINNNSNPRLTDDFVTRVLFPFGDALPIRTVPRTEEVAVERNDDQRAAGGATTEPAGIPSEVVLAPNNSPLGPSPTRPLLNGKHQPKKTIPPSKGGAGMGKKVSAHADRTKDADPNDDEEEGVSIDNLTCCVCWESTATDDNDLVMCDGGGCARAYHMRCVLPHLTPDDLEQDDWFCPICTCLADLMHLIQSETLGDEWEVRRRARAAKHLECDGSLKSWDGADEVFPESEWEYETAQRLVKNQHDSDTNRLLARVLGVDVNGDENSDVGSDDDDDDDDHFDPDEFEKEKQMDRDDGSESAASTSSSQATLLEMSSVELNIGRDELAALSDGTDDDGDDDNDDESEAGAARRSRRLAKKRDDDDDATSSEGDARRDDPGRLDESNILPGKRNRKPVDYRRLNDALFGDLPDDENVILDAGEDYLERATASSSGKRSSTATSSSSSTRENGEHGDSDEESSDSSRPPAKKRTSHEARGAKSTAAKRKDAPKIQNGRSKGAASERSSKPSTRGSPPLKATKTKPKPASRGSTSNGKTTGEKASARGRKSTASTQTEASPPLRNGTKRKRGASKSRG